MPQLNREFRNFKIFYGLIWSMVCFLSPIIVPFSIFELTPLNALIFCIFVGIPLILHFIYSYRLEKEIRKKYYKIVNKLLNKKIIKFIAYSSFFIPTISLFILAIFTTLTEFIYFLFYSFFYLIISPLIILYLIKLLKLRLPDEFLNEESNN